MALSALNLIQSYTALKKLQLLMQKQRDLETPGTSPAQAEAKARVREARYISQAKSNEAAAYYNQRAQSDMLKRGQMARLQYQKERESRRSQGTYRSPGMPSTAARVEESATEKLSFLGRAEEIKSRFPREVLAARMASEQENRNMLDRWRRYQAEDDYYRRGSGTPTPPGSIDYSALNDLQRALQSVGQPDFGGPQGSSLAPYSDESMIDFFSNRAPSIAPLELLDLSQYD